MLVGRHEGLVVCVSPFLMGRRGNYTQVVNGDEQDGTVWKSDDVCARTVTYRHEVERCSVCPYRFYFPGFCCLILWLELSINTVLSNMINT